MQGICVTGMMNIGVTLIGDLFQDYERAKAMGYRTSAQNLVNAIMFLLAGFLATIAWFYPFLIYSLAIPVGVLVWMKLDTIEDVEKNTFKQYIKAAGVVIRHSKTIWIFFTNFMMFVLLYCIVVYVPMIITDELDFSTAFAGLALSVGSTTAALFSSQTGKFRKFFDEHLLIFGGFCICGFALFLISLAQSLIWIFLPLIYGELVFHY